MNSTINVVSFAQESEIYLFWNLLNLLKISLSLKMDYVGKKS